MSVNLKVLTAKLNDATRRVMDTALSLCVARTHYELELEHYLLRAMDGEDNDIAAILNHYGVDRARLLKDIDQSLLGLRRGSAGKPGFSADVVKMLSEAWTIASIDFNAANIRTGFTLIALLDHRELARAAKGISKELELISCEGLIERFYDIVASSKETQLDLGDVAMASARAQGGDQSTSPATGGKTPHLDQYTVNLTANAKAAKIDPVLGRDHEVRQMIDILMRRRQNNPILTGEAGVGKTAVVEGFANRVASGDVPPALIGVQVHSLDLALLQAGAGVKGEFENRLKGLISEVKSSTKKVILFIDEAHTMIGAGGQAGQNDAANLLKPALARGELRTIAATTWSEYKKYFEKDPALARRFQVVKVEEPTEDVACIMLRGIVASLEKYHQLRILDEAVTATVRLSHRYIAGRQLPDKAVSVLDTACARLSLGQHSTPPRMEDAMRTIDALEAQRHVLTRESALGADHVERLAEIESQITAAKTELASLEEQWNKERGLVERIRKLQGVIEDPDGKAAVGSEDVRGDLSALESELAALQGERGMIRVSVDAQIVGEVISGWTGIPLGKMMKDEIQTVLSLDEHLKRRVIGQDDALAAIAQRILTSRANLDDPVKPVGVFLLVGPSGVGKTETAIALADVLYGGERNMITINMSEFQESHTVSTLKGSPPGYVGYGEGGVLTEAVRRRPYSVVLLDEVEKAHPDVLELFFQVFDKGRMEDGEGREIDFRNTIILLTSNAATDTLMKLCADPETMPDSKGLLGAMKPELNKIFKPAFLGRMLIVPYYPVRDEALKQIIRLKLGKIQRRLVETHRVVLAYDDVLLNEVAARCTEVESGARNVDNILSNTLLPDLSRQILSLLAEGSEADRVSVSVKDGELTYAWDTIAPVIKESIEDAVLSSATS